MNKKRIMILVIAVVIALQLSSCKSENNQKENNSNENAASTEVEQDKSNLASEQILHLNIDNDPTTLDPQVALDGNALEVASWTFDSLIRKTKEGKYEPLLAESWEISEDELVYSFKIRDAKWSDGTKIVANDFLASWVRVLTPETAAGNAYLLYSIKNAQELLNGDVGVEDFGVKVLDESTVEITLNSPTPYFLELMTKGVYSVMKTEFMEENGTNIGTSAELMIASGPFVISKWNHEQEVILKRNPHYWDNDSIIIEKIEFLIIGDVNVLVNMYEANEIEMVGVTAEYFDKYADSKELDTKAANNLSYIVFNNNDEFMKNVNLRKALSYAFDRDTFYSLVDINMVRLVSDEIAVMYLGNIVEIGSSYEVFHNPIHPYTEALISAVPKPNPELERSGKRIILEGDVPSPMVERNGCVFEERCRYATDICLSSIPTLREIRTNYKVACHNR